MAKFDKSKLKRVAGHICEGKYTNNSNGADFDCEYYPDIDCEDCVFNVGYYSNDYRRGKRPWAKCNGGS